MDDDSPLHAVFHHHPDAMWIHDRDTLGFLAVNEAALELYGYSREQFMAMSVGDIGTGQHAEVHVQTLKAASTATGREGVWRHRRRSGDSVYVDVHSLDLSYAGHDACLVVARDVTRLVNLEQERQSLHELETRLRTAQRLLHLGFWHLDMDSGALSWSADVYDMYGVRPDSFGHDYNAYVALVHPDDRAAMEAGYADFESGTTAHFEFEHRVLAANGEVRHMRGVGERADTADHRILAGVVRDVTRQTEDAERLATATRLLSLAGRTARLGGWRVDLDADRVTWTSETAAIHEEPDGTSPSVERAIGYYAPEYRPRIEQAFRTCATQGLPFDEVLQLITARGNRPWVRAIGEADRDADGRIIAVQGAFQDISELVAARDRSAQLERRLEHVLEAVSDAFFTLDHDWRFTYLNGQAERVLERPRETLLGENIWEAFPTAMGTAFQNEYERAMDTKITVRFTGFYPPLEAWFEVNAYPAADGLAVYFRDVTQARASEEQLRLLETAVSRQNDIVVITEAGVLDAPHGPRIVYVNDAFEKLTGYTRAEAVGSTPRLLQGKHTDRGELDRIRTALERRQPVRAELLNYTRAGDELWLELDITPIADHSGSQSHWVAIERDITRRKRDEQAQRSSEERLHESQKLEALGQLTGGIAHDFNNLLTVILGSTELLREQLTAHPHQDSLAETISVAAERAASLTHRLLAVARRQALDPKLVDLGRLVAGMESLLRRTLAEDIDILISRGDGLWNAEVDPSQFEMALLNLSINARDAMTAGGRLTIETANATLDDTYAATRHEVQPGHYVLLSVSDTGAGMSPDTLARAFEPFFTTKDVGKGSGLGLSMVYGFAKQSGGHANIYSEPGQGTTIRLYFPRAWQGDAPASAGAGDARTPAGGEECILVVEDDELVRSHVTAQLRGLGYRVLAAGTGPEALKLVEENNGVDLLFTDVVMPGGMNGRELSDAARALRPGLAVLFTSGYTENAIVHHGRLDRGVQLLSKPYRLQQLAAKVREVLDAERSEQGPHEP